MKKTIALILAVGMLLALCACNGLRGKNRAFAGVFWYDENDAFLGEVRNALNKELDSAHIDHENYFAAGNQSKQIDQIKAAVASGVDLLVVNQVTVGSLATARDIMTVAGEVPVVFFNRVVGSDQEAVAEFFVQHPDSCFIGTDSPTAGQLQGDLVGNYTVEHYEQMDLNGDGEISYALFKGDDADETADYRSKCSVENANGILAAAGKPELRYFDPYRPASLRYQADPDGRWSAAAAEILMEKNLKRYNEEKGTMIELVICNNDDMAQGVIRVLQAHGYNTKGGHTVPVFGLDATQEARKLIADGSMAGTINQDADAMAQAIRGTAEGIVEGLSPRAAMAAMKDSRFHLYGDYRLNIDYAPYLGK